jgi:hypothetical protein
MKTIVVILLLSTSGVERYEIKTSGLDCGQIAEKWREINTKYYDSRNKDPKQQGNYTSDGKLMIGYLCE